MGRHRRALSDKELDRLISELAIFARSNIPMPQGLAQLHENLRDGDLKTLTSHVAKLIDQGQPLSAALESGQISVSPPFVAMVRCSEVGGNLSGVLEFALKQGRMIRSYRSSIGTILIYPLLVLALLIVIFGFTVTIIVPKFQIIFGTIQSFARHPNEWLPLPVQAAFVLSDFSRTSLGLILIILAFGAVLYIFYAALSDRLSTNLLERLPGLNRLVYLSDTAVMAEFIGYLVSCSVPMPDACRATSLVVFNGGMRNSLEVMAAEAERGAATGDVLNPRMPATAAWLYRQGEARGTLPDACKSISRYCNTRFTVLSRRALFFMEPMFLLTVAIVVGLVVVAFYLPLFRLFQVGR